MVAQVVASVLALVLTLVQVVVQLDGDCHHAAALQGFGVGG